MVLTAVRTVNSAPNEPHRGATVWYGARTATVRVGNKPLRFATVRDIFSRNSHMRTHPQFPSPSPIQTCHCSRIQSHCHSFSALTAFTHAAILAYDRVFAVFLSLSIHTRRCSRIRSHFRWFLLSLCNPTPRCSRIRSHFGCFCSLTAFSYAAPDPLSHRQSHFRCICSLSILTRRCSRIRSPFGSFCFHSILARRFSRIRTWDGLAL